jgi:hypothetical protein
MLAVSIKAGNEDDAKYDAYLATLQAKFLANIENGSKPLFTTDADGLFAAYLETFPVDKRQYHNCHACKTFMERFGGLVTIGPDGSMASAIWDEEDAPVEYRDGITAVAKIVRRSKVTGVFLSSHEVWGRPSTGVWHHFAVTPPASIKYSRATQNAGQMMAEKKEDFITVTRALNEFTEPMIKQAVTLLKTDALYRSEKVLGQAEWLAKLHADRSTTRGQAAANVLWLAVALAPAGFCHPRSSMIGTLLEDIAAGLDYDDVSKKFAAKMHPLQYQRPQAAPTAGEIAAAEKIMAQLARRFCRVDEVKAIWKPAVQKEAESKGGIFGHLTPKGKSAPSALQMPVITMTWTKFAATVLPGAEKIEFYASLSREGYAALVTAVNPEAPPILQWDSVEARNPVCWYVWHGGSTPEEFSLKSSQWHTVEAVTLNPAKWGGESFSHHGESVLFLLEGAKETKCAGAALFPEFLKSEFHAIRSVIEAYSRSAKIEGLGSPHAAGAVFTKGSTWKNALFRVTSKGQTVEYRLDRWD